MSKITKAMVKQAIKGSGGIMSTIAKRLNCEWHTASRHVAKDDDTRQALQDEKEGLLDMAEGILYQSIREGNTQDAKWFLSTKGRNRGFSEKLDIDHSGGITLVIDEDDAKL